MASDFRSRIEEANGVFTEGWTEIIPGGAIVATMFTTSPGTSQYATDVLQTPWVLNAEGNVYRWAARGGNNAEYGLQGSWVQVPTPRIRSISDGAIVGEQTNVLYECGTAACSAREPTSAADWVPTVAPLSDIRQIAHSGPVTLAIMGGNPKQIIWLMHRIHKEKLVCANQCLSSQSLCYWLL